VELDPNKIDDARRWLMAAEWYFEELGEVFGPFSIPDLRNIVQRGRVSSDDRLRKGREGRWVEASSVEGLFDRKEGEQQAPGTWVEKKWPEASNVKGPLDGTEGKRQAPAARVVVQGGTFTCAICGETGIVRDGFWICSCVGKVHGAGGSGGGGPTKKNDAATFVACTIFVAVLACCGFLGMFANRTGEGWAPATQRDLLGGTWTKLGETRMRLPVILQRRFSSRSTEVNPEWYQPRRIPGHDLPSPD
jgi:hypothetical protein